jgi:peptidoglycan/xylan/chitin deacetylase (PgdA/CDA1 family)
MALTFDDGPDPKVTPRILDILASHQIKATFFVVGKRVGGQEALLRRIHTEGHEIGNHSWSHPSFTKLSTADMEQQLRATQQAIVRAGVPAPTLFRPPYGAVDTAVLGHARMTIVRWDIDPADWEVKDAQRIKDHLIAHAHAGGIALLHDVHPSTADALELVLPELTPRYHFVTASHLLNVTPGDQGMYFGRP